MSPGPEFGRCNRSVNWHGQIVEMHGYRSFSLSLSCKFIFCGMMCKPGLTGLHGSYAPESAIRDGMKFTWKYPDVSELFLDVIAVFSREAGKRSITGY